MEKKLFIVINDDANCETVVLLTEREAQAIDNFIDWMDIGDRCSICAIDEFDAEDWGKKAGGY